MLKIIRNNRAQKGKRISTDLGHHMRCVLAIAVLGTALYVIISGTSAGAEDWAYGVMGTVVGYVFRGRPS